ncbi:hypothetical protein DRH14_00315 [Candidatus Shapirobacteria bacterium]|nr:MAG: hypothetical protein DRH14_00315 [Candidatus Shapirobacteria bacterium]
MDCFFINIVGWSAGIEGQLPGFVAISAFFIAILALKHSFDITQWPVIILAGSVVGAYLALLRFNFFPQQIQAGYSAKSLAGFFLSLLSILSGAKLATLLFILAVPFADAVFVILKRLFSGHSIFISDGQHFHHHLLELGWSRQQIAILYWSFSLLFGILSLVLNSWQKFLVLIILFSFLFLLIFQVSRHTSKKSNPPFHSQN